MKNWQTYNYGELEEMLTQHRIHAVVLHDEECFCWDVEKFLYQQERTLDHPSDSVCGCGSVAGVHCDWCPCANKGELS